MQSKSLKLVFCLSLLGGIVRSVAPGPGNSTGAIQTGPQEENPSTGQAQLENVNTPPLHHLEEPGESFSFNTSLPPSSFQDGSQEDQLNLEEEDSNRAVAVPKNDMSKTGESSLSFIVMDPSIGDKSGEGLDVVLERDNTPNSSSSSSCVLIESSHPDSKEGSLDSSGDEHKSFPSDIPANLKEDRRPQSSSESIQDEVIPVKSKDPSAIPSLLDPSIINQGYELPSSSMFNRASSVLSKRSQHTRKGLISSPPVQIPWAKDSRSHAVVASSANDIILPIAASSSKHDLSSSPGSLSSTPPSTPPIGIYRTSYGSNIQEAFPGDRSQIKVDNSYFKPSPSQPLPKGCCHMPHIISGTNKLLRKISNSTFIYGMPTGSEFSGEICNKCETNFEEIQKVIDFTLKFKESRIAGIDVCYDPKEKKALLIVTGNDDYYLVGRKPAPESELVFVEVTPVDECVLDGSKSILSFGYWISFIMKTQKYVVSVEEKCDFSSLEKAKLKVEKVDLDSLVFMLKV